MLKSKKQRAIFLVAFAVVALGTCLTLTLTLTNRTPESSRPQPTTITTTSGAGTTATYQVQETSGSGKVYLPEGSPASIAPGQSSTLTKIDGRPLPLCPCGGAVAEQKEACQQPAGMKPGDKRFPCPPAMTDEARFRVTPLGTVEGWKVMIYWNVPDGENIKVNGREVPTTERDGRIVSLSQGMITEAAPASYTLTATGADNRSTSATSDVTTYRLEATRINSGEPIMYEAKLKLRPSEK